MKKLELILILAIIVGGFAVRLYKIDRPIADWHSWRQADTAAVSRNFLKEGFNPFIPKYDDMSAQANSKDNPNRYRFVEFPIYNSIIALIWYFTGTEIVFARLVNVFASLVSTFFLYLIVKKISGTKTGLFAALFFAFIPFNTFYSTSILPGPFMVTATLGFYYFFIRFLENSNKFYLLVSILSANVAILSWPISLFFLLPIMWLIYEKFNKYFYKEKLIQLFAFSIILPFAVWRIWMLNFPEGIPGLGFLLNEGDIRFKGAFFIWIISERLGGLILGTTGFALFALGFVRKIKKVEIFYYAMLASSLLYITVFASGNVRHDYYQVPIVPTLAIFMALGASLLTNSKIVNKIVGYPLVFLLVIFSFALSFYELKGFYWVNRPEIVEAGKKADEILPKDAIIIAPYGGDTALLYQTNRYGYPFVDRPLVQLIQKNANYLVSVDVGDSGIKKLSENCKILEKTDKYIILELSIKCAGG